MGWSYPRLIFSDLEKVSVVGPEQVARLMSRSLRGDHGQSGGLFLLPIVS